MGRMVRMVTVAVWLACASGATAATFNVDSTSDAVDAKVGDGKCASVDGSCTLRAAVQEANARADGDTIILPAGTYQLSLAPQPTADSASGDLDLTTQVTIIGSGSGATIVDGGQLDRVFSIAAKLSATGESIDTGDEPASADISALTVRNGTSLAGEDGGGIFNGGKVKLMDVVVRGCLSSAKPQAQGGRGGGLFNDGRAELLNANISGNAADAAGGGVFSSADATTILASSSVMENKVAIDKGGGIANEGALSILATTVSGNRAVNGGGLVNLGGTADVVGSTFRGNTAGRSGGAIANYGKLSIRNSTLSTNAASEGAGALLNGPKSTASLNNATISGNAGGSDKSAKGGGVVNENGATLTVNNTIISGNTAGGGAPDCSGSITSLGHCLIQDSTGCTIGGEEDTIVGVDPKLGPLGDDGGLTQLLPLLAGSPAIDAGNPAPPSSGDRCCESADQRGVKRPINGSNKPTPICDIGAYEFQP